MNKTINKLLIGSIFLLPLLGVYNEFGYEQIKVLFFILSISLIGFLWFFQKPKIIWTKIKIASWIFILILFLTSILGMDIKVSFLGNQPYFQGWIVYGYLGLLSLIVSSLDIKLEYYALAFTSSALIVSSLGIEDWVLKNMGFLVPNYAGRIVSTFGQPNFYAGFLLLNLPFCYFLFKNTREKLSYFGLIVGLTSIVGIFVSYSRSTIILALILLSLGLVDQLKIKLKLGLIVLGIIFISIFIAWKSSSGLVGNEISNPLLTNNPDLTKESVEKRAYIWPVVWQIFLQKPLGGFGLENIQTAFSAYFKKYKHPIFEENLNINPVLISLKELNIDRTHNYFLDLMLFSGILGILGWLIFVLFILKRCRNKYLLVGLLTYLIWIQFQNQSIVHLIYFYFLIGVIDKG